MAGAESRARPRKSSAWAGMARVNSPIAPTRAMLANLPLIVMPSKIRRLLDPQAHQFPAFLRPRIRWHAVPYENCMAAFRRQSIHCLESIAAQVSICLGEKKAALRVTSEDGMALWTY